MKKIIIFLAVFSLLLTPLITKAQGYESTLLNAAKNDQAKARQACINLNCAGGTENCSAYLPDPHKWFDADGNYYCINNDPVVLTKPVEDLITPANSISIPFLKYTTINPKLAVSDDGYLYIPWIGEFFAIFYKVGVAIGSLLAAVMIIIQGLRIVASGGGDEKMAGYKKIGQIVAGLILLWGSYTFLFIINPNLVNFKPLRIKYIKGEDIPVILLTDNSLTISGTADKNSGQKTRNGTLVPYFKQTDPAWQECQSGDKLAIAHSGCGITSLAMVLNYWGANVNPCSLYRANNNSTLLQWEKITKQVPGKWSAAKSISDQALIKKCLANNIPIIIYTTVEPWTKKYHLMVMTDYDASTRTFLLNNPGSDRGELSRMPEEKAFSPNPPKRCRELFPSICPEDDRVFPRFILIYDAAKYNDQCDKLN